MFRRYVESFAGPDKVATCQKLASPKYLTMCAECTMIQGGGSTLSKYIENLINIMLWGDQSEVC